MSMQKRRKEKIGVARLSILSNTLLIILKVIVGFITGSVSIISEAIHSFMDLLASFIAYFSVKISANPPDSRHPYGHGKVENLSGLAEAILIFVAAGWIIYEAISKILDPHPVDSIGWGALVMFISGFINIFVSRKLYKVARKTDSIALEADALHLKTDVLTSFGVGTGLILLWITNIYILDSVIAILVALFILYEAFDLFKRSLYPIIDEAWCQEDMELLCKTLDELGVNYHEVKTRKSGNFHFLEFHMNVDPEETVGKVHILCDKIEDKLKQTFSDITTTIHVEPFE